MAAVGGSSVDGHTELYHGGICGVPNLCGEGQSVSAGAGAPKGHHRYTGVCRGGRVRVKECNFCVHGREDAMWGAACAQWGQPWEGAQGTGGVKASGREVTGKMAQTVGASWCEQRFVAESGVCT